MQGRGVIYSKSNTSYELRFIDQQWLSFLIKLRLEPAETAQPRSDQDVVVDKRSGQKEDEPNDLEIRELFPTDCIKQRTRQ